MSAPSPEPRPHHAAQTPQVISKFYDFMMWFMDRTQRFPRNYRGTLTRWIEDQLWGVLDLLIEAAYTRHKLPLLEQSNLRLQKLRFLTRICKDRQCLSLHQYEYAARLINEIGTELGSWIKQQQARQA
jgi:hypothetical protein